jgi:hypothetical protein
MVGGDSVQGGQMKAKTKPGATETIDAVDVGSGIRLCIGSVEH